MLRQLARLTHRVPAAGPNAVAVAVYSDDSGHAIGARETGVEGVACIDDAARAAVLLCRLWQKTNNEAIRRWAEGLVDFVIWMGDGEGRWVNFIYDWTGAKNVDGPTSVPGINFWQARATEALATAAVTLGRDDAAKLVSQALATAAGGVVPSDVRVIHIQAALESLKRRREPALEATVATWCDEVAAFTSNGILMNSPDERGTPHLWGHIQEGVLAQAAVRLDRPRWLGIARASAEACLLPIIDSGFTLPHASAYGVQSAVFDMDQLWAATGEARFAQAAARSRAWFDGANPAGHPVYRRGDGSVSDGIDGTDLNRNTGAESTICAGLALIEDPFVTALASGWL